MQETEENTIPKETESSPPVIVAFGTSEGSLTIPKGTLEAVLAQLPSSVQVTLEDGQTVDVAASWECTDDYENTEYERYTFLFGDAGRLRPGQRSYRMGSAVL